MLQTGLHNKLTNCYDAIKKALRVTIGDSTNDVDIIPTNGSNGLVVIEPNHISTDNSTTSLLGAGATFTGTGEDITNYAIMFINVFADVASATDGLCIDASYNGSDWHETECYTIAANTYKTFSIQCASKYIRLRYTNGATPQTDFHIEVKLCTKDSLDSSHRIADSISDQDDATLSKSVLTAQNPDSQFINIQATKSNNLRVTDAESGLAIAKGDVANTAFTHKFGNAPDFGETNGQVTIWDGAEDGTAWENMVYDYSATADIDSISSSDVGDTVDIVVVGLDANYNEVEQTVTLNGQTRVALSTSLIRVYRAYNDNGTDLVGHVVIYPNTALTLGVPTDKSKIRAVIDPVNQQTEMAVYTIPAGYTGYMRSWYTSASGANKSSNYTIRLRSRDFGKVFRTKHVTAIADDGSSYIQHNYTEPEKFTEKTDIEMTAEMLVSGGTGAAVSGGFDIVLVQN